MAIDRLPFPLTAEVTAGSTNTLTNKSISGSTNTITNVSLTSGVTGTLPIANGGTGQTTAQAAIDALVPSQASANGKYLASDGTNVSWESVVALPDQSGNNGKYLSTDGTDASWVTLSVDTTSIEINAIMGAY